MWPTLAGDDDDDDDWDDDDEYLFATFLDHSEPSPLPPLRPLGHGGD